MFDYFLLYSSTLDLCLSSSTLGYLYCLSAVFENFLSNFWISTWGASKKSLGSGADTPFMRDCLLYAIGKAAVLVFDMNLWASLELLCACSLIGWKYSTWAGPPLVVIAVWKPMVLLILWVFAGSGGRSPWAIGKGVMRRSGFRGAPLLNVL